MFNQIMNLNIKYRFIIVFTLVFLGVLFPFITGIFFGGIFIISFLFSNLMFSSTVNRILFLGIYSFSLIFHRTLSLAIDRYLSIEITFAVTMIFVGYSGTQLKKYIEALNGQNQEIIDFNKDLILGFINTIEAKNSYLCGHSLNVSFYAQQICEQLNLPLNQSKTISLAGLFHDIGKVSVNENILEKADCLTKEEWSVIKTHPEIGAKIVKNVPTLKEISEIIRCHHLHYSGKGYPDGPVKKQIPLGARIVSVADAFDAMTTKRCYRNAMSIEEAFNELKNCSGSQFDPDIVKAFLKTPLINLAKQTKQEEIIKRTLRLYEQKPA